MSSYPATDRIDEAHAQISTEENPMASWKPIRDPSPRDAEAHPAAGNAGPTATATSQHRNDRVRAPVPPFPRDFWSRLAGFVALQEWEGHVTDIRDGDFVARLWDLTGGAEREEEEATIPFAEISEDDRAKMRLGSIFRWSIGYEHTEGGTKRRVSQIVFRDLPCVTKTDLQEASDWAAETLRLLGL